MDCENTYVEELGANDYDTLHGIIFGQRTPYESSIMRLLFSGHGVWEFQEPLG